MPTATSGHLQGQAIGSSSVKKGWVRQGREANRTGLGFRGGLSGWIGTKLAEVRGVPGLLRGDGHGGLVRDDGLPHGRGPERG